MCGRAKGGGMGLRAGGLRLEAFRKEVVREVGAVCARAAGRITEVARVARGAGAAHQAQRIGGAGRVGKREEANAPRLLRSERFGRRVVGWGRVGTSSA